MAKNALAVPERTLNRNKGFAYRWRKYYCGYAFMLPFLILLFTFTILPVFTAVGYSFTTYNMIQPAVFNGLGNYKTLLFEDDVFYTTLKNTFVFALFIGPIGYFMSFFMAWILDRLKFRNLFSLMFYAPSITSGTAMTVVWLYFFSNDRFGLINNVLLNIGIISEPILWNQESTYIFPAVIIIQVWMSMGTGFLVFLAGFQNLSTELFEQGRIDGIKNRFQELIYLTLPLMKPQLLFGAITSITGSFAVYDVIAQFCGVPSPNYCADTLVAHLFDFAFTRFEMGVATAIAVVLFLITFILGKVCMALLKTDDY